jgi:plastocyanin
VIRLALLLAAAVLTACTPNGIAASSGSGGGGVTHVVDVNLTLNAPSSTPYGSSGGMKPAVLVVNLGDSIVFENSDSFAHTSTSIPASKSAGGTAFPSAYPFDGAALTQSGTTLSGGWSSGSLQPGGKSQTIKADKAGTYLYGCFYHYGAPMRGAIVVK